ncbi:antibiotic biosynthesis monooxygenase [Salinibacterium sp. UTAS2018]|uniref:antibiotic biosynthesis monooxygenase n=1 Tax=Salinibacterium sp. UTAS2018 TaxID=2508880 RepID=UPI001009485F|nr:antibiotic biosynthesis monooxygenase [Salinibacterium sp. UTAS2018]QAV71239.1 antibiotic biosynthesis monooxygenase [Salinibacterium sp. UTAS2018]
MSPENAPITISIERTVDPARIAEATAWMQTGINLATSYPGFLGSGWVRAGTNSTTWHMLYRFADDAALLHWEQSPERAWWLQSGSGFVHDQRTERRTGIEGWFDEPTEVTVEQAGLVSPVPAAPPRWKQAVTIWLGFFPLNLLFTLLVTMLVPGWDALPIVVRVLLTTLCLTPIMTYVLLPGVTRMLRRWLSPRP